VALPVRPPLQPMLARLVRELPAGDDFVFEPKWDGFRALAFRSNDDVDIRSRNDRAFARYFPEIVDALRALSDFEFVVDGELIVVTDHGFDFEALMLRLHPVASRVVELARATPASFVAFDLLAVGEEDLRPQPFAERRRRLEGLLPGDAQGVVTLTPATNDGDVARRWLDRFQGVDGVVAKRRDQPYEPGRRSMFKVKAQRTVDCVVAGFRIFPDEPSVASLLLGLYDSTGALVHIGVAASFAKARRVALLDELAPRVVPIEAHPWAEGFGLGRSPVGRLKGAAGRWTPDMGQDWVPVAPDLVCEITYDHVEHGRFRHPARFVRWRPDREPTSCTFEQIDEPEPVGFDALLLPGERR
jgi:ATP-dependent DNA ligase